MVYWYIGGMGPASAHLDEVVEEAKKVEKKEMAVRIFFGNKEMNQNQADCKKVFPVERTVTNDLIVKRRAMEELLVGPTAEEAAQGYYSAIPNRDEVTNYREKIKQETGQDSYEGDQVIIRSVKIMIGMVYVDFSKEIFATGDDRCRIDMIKAQLSETAKQFPKIGGAIITILGEENVF